MFQSVGCWAREPNAPGVSKGNTRWLIQAKNLPYSFPRITELFGYLHDPIALYEMHTTNYLLYSHRKHPTCLPYLELFLLEKVRL